MFFWSRLNLTKIKSNNKIKTNLCMLSKFKETSKVNKNYNHIKKK